MPPGEDEVRVRAAIGLGLVNAWRNLGSSVVAIMAMAVAAGSLSLSLAVSRGLPGRASQPVRALVGGDILVIPGQVTVSPQRVWAAAAGQSLGLEQVPLDLVTDLVSLLPSVYGQGYLAPAGGAARWVPAREIVRALAGRPGVAAVRPGLLLPAEEVHLFPEAGRGPVRLPTVLRGYAGPPFGPGGPAGGLEPWVVEGRFFTAADAGRLVALVAADRAGASVPGAPGGHPLVPVGQAVTLRLPALRTDGEGVWFDYPAGTEWRLEVIGHYLLGDPQPPRRLPGGRGPSGPGPTPYVVVPAATFERLFEAASGGRELLVPQASVTVAQPWRLERTADALRRALPEYTVYSVPHLVAAAGRPWPAVVPLGLGHTLAVLIYGMAAVLLATNLWVLLIRRRAEIGALKALGAGPREVFTLVLTEAVLLALIGAAVGFLAVRGVAGWARPAEGADRAQLVAMALADGGIVLALTVGLALVFAAVPAARAALAPPMEVIRR